MTTDCSWNYHGITMNNLLSYCRLVDTRIGAFEKDLPECTIIAIWEQKKFEEHLDQIFK